MLTDDATYAATLYERLTPYAGLNGALGCTVWRAHAERLLERIAASGRCCDPPP